MKIQRAEIYEYKLPLRKPLTLSGAPADFRLGLIVKLTDDKGFVGYGEGKMAFELAQVHARANAQGKRLCEAFGNPARTVLAVNALLDPVHEAIAASTLAYVSQGYTHFKIKVGRQDFKSDVETVKMVRQLVGKKAQITLDANRAYSLETAIELGHACKRFNIAYIEEPVQDPSKISQFYDATGMPIALDETLDELLPAFESCPRGVSTLMVKPGRLISLAAYFDLQEKAQTWGLQCVIRSDFESGVGLALWAQLAGIRQTAAFVGLSTYDWFKKDVLDPPFRPSRARIDLLEQGLFLNQFNLTESEYCRLIWESESLCESLEFGQSLVW